jgi:hypothetical protein
MSEDRGVTSFENPLFSKRGDVKELTCGHWYFHRHNRVSPIGGCLMMRMIWIWFYAIDEYPGKSAIITMLTGD